MRNIIIALLLTVLTTVHVVADESSDVMAKVHQFGDAMNKGDIQTATAACTPELSIIDDFPPHAWHGKEAFSQWMKDLETDAKKKGLSDFIISLGKPRHVDVTDDRAYVVVPANCTYKENGVAKKLNGSLMTLAMQKTKSGWQIAGWAWARN